ncbi:MAG: thermonuclease family protein [Phototrophicaceae bacterium]
MSRWTISLVIIMMMLIAACDDLVISDSGSGSSSSNNIACTGECGLVVNVVDGDTIDVLIDGIQYRVRYVGINTPERDEVCYTDATAANALLVSGQTVRLEVDTSETDRYGRLLRYIYVGNTFVNEILVADGYAEAVLYNPDDEYYDDFRRFEVNAARNGLGCHPTGIFDDNNAVR